ncbi:acyl-CoA reductase [Novosphingobium album (ex Liu et al. 2023)]|uniref:Acyl-CoA reductase n=1 Tax=Novosphingobium album (ex Liu et al. 2023) TaxID=3031130 RepID=A0ABT5WMD0_9SPHN|nr:acyl-CoA reductase [Novosphingobium album (ex Liu et al. 2023)]MDE8651198.1 acyl-CoA reductase [Novosphingobium album (ex Liu et al. 2023)]
MTDLTSLGAAAGEAVRAPFFIRGKLVDRDEARHVSRDLGVAFASPKLNLDDLVTPRAEPGPLFDVKLGEIIDFLVETGQRLDYKINPYLQECLERTAKTNPLPKAVIENIYRRPGRFATREALEFQVEANFHDPAFLDGWVERTDPYGQRARIRAFPPRLVHIAAGNSPSGAFATISQGALVKAVNLIKMPSSDPFTVVAILRTMADIDPDHPVVRAFTAVYWRGGDEAIERTLFRPQYFDRIVGWGGGDAINNLIKYLGPGLQLISFDPKASISIIGPEAFASEETMDEVAELAAADITVFNQEACIASRFVFAEGPAEGIDRFCEKLLARLAVDREYASAKGQPPPADIRDEIKVLTAMGGEYRVWGHPDGAGVVIRSPEPVDFHPVNKTANVIPVARLEDAFRYVNVATQTVGVYPAQHKARLRDGLAGAGAQRIVRLGSAARNTLGSPHDAMYPLARFVHWTVDEDI